MCTLYAGLISVMFKLVQWQCCAKTERLPNFAVMMILKIENLYQDSIKA